MLKHKWNVIVNAETHTTKLTSIYSNTTNAITKVIYKNKVIIYVSTDKDLPNYKG